MRLRTLRAPLVVMLVSATLVCGAAGATARTSLALFTATTAVQGGSFTSGHWASTAITYYLHNTVPPIGSTNALSDLPMTTDLPTPSSLANYALDCFPTGTGRTLASTNGGQTKCRSANWLTPRLSLPQVIDSTRGTVALTAWWQLDGGAVGRNIVVDVTLNDVDPSGRRTQIAALPATTWSSSGGLTAHPITFGSVAYTVPAGDRIEVVIAGNKSTFAQQNVVLAYDTTTYRAKLDLP